MRFPRSSWEQMYNASIFSPIALDFGTSTTRLINQKDGILRFEPTAVSYRRMRGNISEMPCAIGQDAIAMRGRVPPSVRVASPLEGGVISDLGSAAMYLRHITNETIPGFWVGRPTIIGSITSAASGLDIVNLREIVKICGASRVKLFPQHITSILGADIDYETLPGALVVNIGAGSTDIAITSFGRTVAQKSIRIGGNHMNMSIHRYLIDKFDFVVGYSTIERVKTEYCTCISNHEAEKFEFEVSGKCRLSGRPGKRVIRKSDLANGIKPVLLRITDRIFEVFQDTPPEIASDVAQGFGVISGGFANAENVEEFFYAETGVSFLRVDCPENSVARGLHRLIKEYRRFQHLEL